MSTLPPVNTPIYSDKSFYAMILGLLSPLLNKWLGVELTIGPLAAILASIVTYIIAHTVGKTKKALAVYAAEKAKANPSTGVNQ